MRSALGFSPGGARGGGLERTDQAVLTPHEMSARQRAIIVAGELHTAYMGSPQ